MIAHMSDSDLAKQLKSLKEEIGPITPNSRPLYERRLLKHLRLEEAASCTIPYASPNADDTCCSETLGDGKCRTVKYDESCHMNGPDAIVPHGDLNGGDVPSNATDSTVFFGVQLQADSAQNSGENNLLVTFPPAGCECEIMRSACLTVCLFVCQFDVSSLISKNHTSKFHQIFCTCYLWLWRGPLMMTVQYIIYFYVFHVMEEMGHNQR